MIRGEGLLPETVTRVGSCEIEKMVKVNRSIAIEKSDGRTSAQYVSNKYSWKKWNGNIMIKDSW